MTMSVRSARFTLLIIMSTIIFTIATPVHATPSEFGFGHCIFYIGDAQHIKKQIRLGKDLCLKWVRTVAPWGIVEPKKGQYNWTLYDRLFKEVDPDTNILVTLYCSNGLYCKYQNIKRNLPGRFKNPNRPPSSIPFNMEDYERFLKAIVTRYKSRVKYWQIGNEIYTIRSEKPLPIGPYWMGSIEEYLELLKASYITIKAADPEAKVLVSGIYFEPWTPDRPIHTSFRKHLKKELERLDYILDKGQNYFDILDFHHYYSPESISPRIKYLREKMASLGYEKDIWITESGGISFDFHQNFKNSLNTPAEQQLQAEEMVKFFVYALDQGIKKIFWMELSPPRKALKFLQNWIFGRMYLTIDEGGNKRKLAYNTLKLLVEKLKNFTKVSKLDSHESYYKFEFKDRKPVFVLWGSQEKDVNLTPYISASKVKVVRTVPEKGRKSISAESVSTKMIRVGRIPIFVKEQESGEDMLPTAQPGQ